MTDERNKALHAESMMAWEMPEQPRHFRLVKENRCGPQSVVLNRDEARKLRDWLTEWLGDGDDA